MMNRLLGWALLTLCAAGQTAPAAEPAVQRLMVTVEETAGIRRFGYPVSVLLPLSQAVTDTNHFRLLENGKPVAAQFRPHGDVAKGIRSVVLDFNASPAPLEKRIYVVEYDPGVKPGDQATRGMRIVTEKDLFRVVHSPDLQFIVPRDLAGLLQAVKTSETDYLRSSSAGLMMRSKEEVHFRAGMRLKAALGRVVKEGPLASTLRFEGSQSLRGGRVAWVVEMDFPLSKSWVRVTWKVEDPRGIVAGLGADLNLNMRGSPLLVDFGAGSYVYAHLTQGQTAVLWAGESGLQPDRTARAWKSYVGRSDALKPYVVGRGQTEGWAHVMDRQRCTAVAVADFARAGEQGEIAIDAGGRLRLAKHFAPKGKRPPPGQKTLRFWLHFVGMPVQVGAVTSPQAMLAPLRVRVKKE
jgi:hypothetical protein